MSDPAKSAHEIEDVLASIRRLVAEGGPVTAKPGPARATVTALAGGAAPQSQPAPSRLVLTPALRVTDPDDPWAPVPLTGDDHDPARAPDAAAQEDVDSDEDRPWALQDRLADWGEIEESGQEAVQDAIAERAAMPDAAGDAMPSGPDTTEAAEGGEPLADFEPETGDANWPDGSAGTALRDLAMARGQMCPDPDQDRAADTAAPADADTPVFSRVLDRRARTTEGAQDHDSAQDDDDQDDDQDDDRADDPQEDLTTAIALDDDIEDLGEARSPFTFPQTDAEDRVLDEETLRDLIADVVRQELQGALGQRITRNVRKMVRREVRMALAAEDLE